MKITDIIVFFCLTIFISVIGIVKAKISKPKKDVEADKLVGSNVSTLSVALAVCSSFISAISLLGYPAEIYYRGAFMYWYCLMYVISFPIIAYVFLPTFYELKLPSLYEYLEKRFSFTCRLLTSTIFLFQTILYTGLVLYAPALALSSAFNISIFVSIQITAFLSAIYLCIGGARAGIYTSAMQMTLIFVSMFLIVILSYYQWGAANIYETAKSGLRLDIMDFRLDSRVRHSFWPLVVGGCFSMFTLYASNQLTMQRYLAMPNLKQAQKVLLLNIPMNIFMLTMYVVLGSVMYYAFVGCHPTLGARDQLLPYFLESKLGWFIGLEGIFLAAVYSAGLSTLTASYNALTAVTIEDLIKVTLKKFKKQKLLTEKIQNHLITYLPIFFAIVAVSLAIVIKHWEAMILQIAFSIFGSIGGVIFGAFCVGLLCPWIKSSIPVICGELAALIACILMVVGTFVFKVRAVNLPLETSCSTNATLEYEWSNEYNRVKAVGDGIYANYSQISYQYYALLGTLINLIVAHVVHLICVIVGIDKNKKINTKYLLHLIRPFYEVNPSESSPKPQETPLIKPNAE